MLRAKMSVFSITKGRCMAWPPDGSACREVECETVKLTAVCGGPGNPNAEWNWNTPTATVEIVIANPAAMGRLEMGKTYFLDFTPADA